jgi:hypothetical protein
MEEPGSVESSKAIEQIRSHTRTFGRCATSLRELQIPSGRLLDYCRENRARYANDNTGEPYDIDHDGQNRLLEWLTTLSCDDLEWCSIGYVDKQLRYLSELGDGFIESIGCFLARIGG